MKYLVTVYQEDDPAMPYEEWAEGERELSAVVTRISSLLRAGDTMIVTDQDDNVMQERRKVAA
jgi:hypothetical protein